MTETVNVSALATAIGTDIKGLGNDIGDLSTLNTTNKTSSVGAINEVLATANAGPEINDAGTSVSDLLSASQIDARISASNDALIGSATGVADTLGEIETLLSTGSDARTALLTQQGLNTTAISAAQGVADQAVLDAAAADSKADQGILDAATANTAAGVADGKAVANTAAITALTNQLGPDTDYVALYNTAKA